MSLSPDDYRFMALAMQLAERGLPTTDPNPNVGCVIVNEAGEIVGQGWHERAGQAHAEIMALDEARELAAGATAYVTLEPCPHHGKTPPCATALITAGITRVVFAMHDPNPLVAGNGERMLIDAGLSVTGGVQAEASREINLGYVSRMQSNKPWVRCKLAVSLDGRTALASGESQWISGEAARADVHRLRACSSAVLTGIGTVLADNPSLTARSAEFEHALQPQRIILDSGLRTPSAAKLFESDSPVQIIHTEAAGEQEALIAAGATLLRVDADNGRADLASVFKELASQQINDVLVEAGPTLSGALLERGLVDELVVYQAATVLGADSRGMFGIRPLGSMAERLQLQLIDVRKIGADVRMIYRPLSEERD